MKNFDTLDKDRLLADKSAEIIRRFYEERQRFLSKKQEFKLYLKETSELK